MIPLARPSLGNSGLNHLGGVGGWRFVSPMGSRFPPNVGSPRSGTGKTATFVWSPQKKGVMGAGRWDGCVFFVWFPLGVSRNFSGRLTDVEFGKGMMVWKMMFRIPGVYFSGSMLIFQGVTIGFP